MQRIFLTLLLLFAAPAVFAEDLPTGPEVMDKITEATGGAEAMKKIESAITRGRMEMAAMNIEGTITTWSKPPHGVRATIELAGLGKVERGANGDIAWEYSPIMGPRLIEGAERDFMLLESDFGWSADWRDYYDDVKSTGTEEANGQPCVLLEMKLKGGTEIKMAVNSETWLPATMNMRMTMQGSEVPVALTYDEYKEVDGLTLPVKITQHVLVQTILVTIDEYEFNVDIPDEQFEMPEAIKELLEAETESGEEASEEESAVDEG